MGQMKIKKGFKNMSISPFNKNVSAKYIISKKGWLPRKANRTLIILGIGKKKKKKGGRCVLFGSFFLAFNRFLLTSSHHVLYPAFQRGRH